MNNSHSGITSMDQISTSNGVYHYFPQNEHCQPRMDYLIHLTATMWWWTQLLWFQPLSLKQLYTQERKCGLIFIIPVSYVPICMANGLNNFVSFRNHLSLPTTRSFHRMKWSLFGGLGCSVKWGHKFISLTLCTRY